jgi:hypothetical protein
MCLLPLETEGSCLIRPCLPSDSTSKEYILKAFKYEAAIYFKVSVPALQETKCLSTTRTTGQCCLQKETLMIVRFIRKGGKMLSNKWRAQGNNWLQALGLMRGKTKAKVKQSHYRP